jgi:tetratricopeptide (TPR) repeat protein
LGLKQIATIPEAQAAGVHQSPESVLGWLSNLQQEWLLVFDNVDGDPGPIGKLLPPGNQGNVLLSSRNPSMCHNVPPGAWAEVDTLEEEEALSLLFRAALAEDRSSQPLLREAGLAIVKELAYLALAIDQAGAAIAQGVLTFKDYLQVYSEHHQLLLSDPRFVVSNQYEKAVYGTWDISYMTIEKRTSSSDQVQAQAAKVSLLILHLFAFFHCQGIEEEIFKRAAEAPEWQQYDSEIDPDGMLNGVSSYLPHKLLQLDSKGNWDPLVFRSGIQILQGFSLVRCHMFNSVYSMHPLVHCWIRDKMMLLDQHERCQSARAVLVHSIGLEKDTESFAFRRLILSHIHTNTQLSKEVVKSNSYNDEEYYKMGYAFEEAGEWTEAEKLYVQVLKMSKRILGQEHPHTLLGMQDLGNIYSKQGKLKEAEDLQVQVLEMSKRILGQEHPHTLFGMQNLGNTYSNQGKWKEAEDLQVQVLEMSKRIRGQEHPDTLSTMQNLGITYSNQGKWKEAEDLLVQVLEMSKRILGQEHPHTLLGMQNLGITYSNQRKWKEGEDLQVQVLEMSKRIHGQEHPDTLLGMHNLGNTYSKQGK